MQMTSFAPASLNLVKKFRHSAEKVCKGWGRVGGGIRGTLHD